MGKPARAETKDPAVAVLERQLQAAQRLRHVMGAREDLLAFAQLAMPDLEYPDDVTRSRFEVAVHHRLIAQALKKVRDGTVSRLAISLPPRHGKSEIATRLFPAWCIGANPYWQIILAGATADFARDEFGRKIRGYMETPMYQQVFPGAGLRGGSKAVDNLTTKEGGNIKSIGKGGQIVGRGADCLVGWSVVETEAGPMRIDAISTMENPPRVLSFRHVDQQLTYNRILATRRIDDREVWKLVTNSGRELIGTADHRVYCGSRGYVRLCDLRPGDALVIGASSNEDKKSRSVNVVGAEMRAMPVAVHSAGLRSEESGRPGTPGHVLREGLLANASCDEKFKALRVMRRLPSEKGRSEDRPKAMRSLPKVVTNVATRACQKVVSLLWNMVLANQQQACLLLKRMRKFCAQRANDGGWKFKIQGWDILRGMVPAYASDHPGTGWIQMRGMRQAARDAQGYGWQASGYSAYPSYRRKSGEQCARELGFLVQALPRCAPQEDVVCMVERVCGVRVPVYDIQVEKDCNFFAGEILVHNCMIIDDPYAGRDEAFSPAERRKVRDWFTSDVISRMMPGGRIVVIHQRWHEDDLIGWLTDPMHPEHNPRISGKWMHLYLPAIVYDPELARLLGIELSVPEDPEHQRLFGARPLRPLWPERYGLDFFAEIKDQSAQAFEALYMGNPVPEDGDFFRREHIEKSYYDPEQLPKNLRYYGASDHAVSEESVKNRDATCMGPAGVDEDGVLWILDDLFWRREDTEVVADAWLAYGRRYKFMTWWAERGHISKSIGPFLRKMMREEEVYVPVDEITPSKDKMTMAQSIRARIALGKVRFPRRASWMQAALDELLKFPNGKHDDFVSFISMLGLGLERQVIARATRPKQEPPRTGTLAWVKDSAKREARRLMARRKGGF